MMTTSYSLVLGNQYNQVFSDQIMRNPTSEGPQGPQGETGPQGPQGETGPSGQDITWRGDWDVQTTYSVNDSVSYLGSSYIAIGESLNELPTNTSYWNIMASSLSDLLCGPGASPAQSLAADREMARKNDLWVDFSLAFPFGFQYNLSIKSIS